MPLNQTQLNYLFKLEVKSDVSVESPDYIKSLALASVGKDSALAGVYTITDKKDLEQYLVDTETNKNLTEAQRAFDFGNKLVLWVFPKEVSKMNQAFVNSYLEDINKKAFTLLFSAQAFDTEKTVLALNYDAYHGVIGASVVATENYSDKLLAFALSDKRMLFSDSQSDGWGLSFMSYFLNQSTFSNCQYLDKVSTTSGVAGPEGKWDYLFTNKINHIMEGGSLGLFAIGGKAGADIYIEEMTRANIQRAFASYISNYNPGYDEGSREQLESAAYFVLNAAKAKGDITDFVSPSIPEVDLQDISDKNNFILNGFFVQVTLKSAIWKIKGTIQS